MKGYEYHNNILSIPASLLYDDWQLITYNQYERWCKPSVRKLIRTKEGKGQGNEAYLSYHDLPIEFQKECIERLGDPADKEIVAINLLEPYIVPDKNAAAYFARHRSPEGKSLSTSKQIQRSTSCFILTAIKNILEDKGMTSKMFGKRKTHYWDNIADAVNRLPAKWDHNLPTSPKHLKRRYLEYTAGDGNNYNIFIHKNEGNQTAAKIRGAVADFLLAKYSLPIKLTIPMVLAEYEAEREHNTKWPDLTREGVYRWLHEPEQERVWTLGRHGKAEYQRKYKHTIERDKSRYFPNVYWAIDGTKLDWVHFKENASNKIGADLRIDVLFDVYSEKILGYSLSESETLIDHFVAIKQAVQVAGCRPYLYTYDKQSGHRSLRMKELYNNLVAVDGGTHYSHRTREHSSPAEHLFDRFQKSTITKRWYSDGQSVTVRREDNKANWEFITEHKDFLKTKEDLAKDFEYVVKQWNNAKHPHLGCTREEAYRHEMPMREDLGILDILQFLWLNETKPIQYRREGLKIDVAGKVYSYEVYDDTGAIDVEFRRLNVGRKFVVRYDPDNMDAFVQLMEQVGNDELRFVANAEPKRKHVDVPVLMEDGDKELWQKDFKVRDVELDRDAATLEALRKRTGITPRKLIEQQELEVKMQHVSSKKHTIKADKAISFDDDYESRF